MRLMMERMNGSLVDYRTVVDFAMMNRRRMRLMMERMNGSLVDYRTVMDNAAMDRSMAVVFWSRIVRGPLVVHIRMVTVIIRVVGDNLCPPIGQSYTILALRHISGPFFLVREVVSIVVLHGVTELVVLWGIVLSRVRR